jgi:hypothetical protein
MNGDAHGLRSRRSTVRSVRSVRSLGLEMCNGLHA